MSLDNITFSHNQKPIFQGKKYIILPPPKLHSIYL